MACALQEHEIALHHTLNHPTIRVSLKLLEQDCGKQQEATMDLIMFDMDGTLFRTDTAFFPAVREFASRHGFAAPEEEFLRSFIGQNGTEWRAWLGQLNLDKPVPELAAEFDLLEQEYVKTQGELYPGAAEVLRSLASSGWKLGICSNAPAWYPEAILTKAGVRELFTVIRVPAHPDQTKTMMLCDVWNEFHPQRCAMVGDRADDMQAAYAGGYFAIGAAYGWAPDELDRADVRIHDITDVPAALAGHWSQATPPLAPEPPRPEQQPTVVQPEQSPLKQTVVPPTAPQPTVVPATSPQEPSPAPLGQPVEPMPAPTPVAPTPAPTPVAPTPAPKPVAPMPAASPVVPTPAAVRPAEPAHTPVAPTPAPPERRSWNPFRRRDDKPR